MFNNLYALKVYNDLENSFKNEGEFLQAVKMILKSIESELTEVDQKNKVLERLFNYDRMIEFKVVWEDDNHEYHVNKGYRVQHSMLLGPYKGGLRFAPSVCPSILKFLALEQTFKNSLTNLPLGGAKGGSDFSAKGKSDQEIMRFCQAFMNELYRYIGPNTDIPAGDLGVGSREIGYLYGQYKKLRNEFNGTMTGKSVNWGGSLCRIEATGYGLIYFVKQMLSTYFNSDLKGKDIIITGSGNVATYALEKALELGANVIAMSDSKGYVYSKNGINLALIKDIKQKQRQSLSNYIAYDKNATYNANPKGIFDIKCEICLPCATQNEITLKEAKILVENGCYLVAEGANMPSTSEAIDYFIANNVLFAPSKAANAGGVSVSAIEMEQNASHSYLSFLEVDNKLKAIMNNIFNELYNYAIAHENPRNLVKAANCVSYIKIRKSMLDQGI